MATTSLYFTEKDYTRLCSIMGQAVGTTDPRLRGDLRRLNDELQTAQVVAAEEIPKDIVTINSKVLVKDLKTGEEETWTLALPQEASIPNRKLSVIAPLGTALLGAREGETVEWKTPESGGRLKVVKVLFQPEAAGRFDL